MVYIKNVLRENKRVSQGGRIFEKREMKNDWDFGNIGWVGTEMKWIWKQKLTTFSFSPHPKIFFYKRLW